jgi:hypothetical protein
MSKLKEFQTQIARARGRELRRMKQYSAELDRRLHVLNIETRLSQEIKSKPITRKQ